MKSSTKNVRLFCTLILSFEILAASLASAQTAVWTNYYNRPGNGNEHANAMAVDPNGNVAVTGYSYGGATPGYDYATVKYSNAGVPLWTNRYNGPGNNTDDPLGIAFDASGNVLVAGFSYGSGSGSDFAVIKYSGTGIPLWTNRYNGTVNGDDECYGVATDTNGNVFVTGETEISAASVSAADVTTIKYSSAGALSWVNTYNGPGNGEDSGTAIAVDGNGDVVLTGSSTGSSGNFNYVTIKYSNAGVALWTNRYVGPAGGNDQPYAIAVDTSNNVFVTGYSTGTSSGEDYTTIKYSNAGIPLWTNRYDGTGDGSDTGIRLAVDLGGNVIVTGYSQGNGSGYDYATIKYSGAGLPLWTNRYNGPANGDDYALAVAVDASGSSLVTGFSTGLSSGQDYTTIKYSNAGVPVWTNYYNGPGNGNDSGYAVAADGYGNVIATGTATGISSGSDIATIKFHDDTAPAPVVSLSVTHSNAFALSWPSAMTGFTLQTATNMAAPNWTADTDTLNDNGTNRFIVASTSKTNRFYRLPWQDREVAAPLAISRLARRVKRHPKGWTPNRTAH